MHEYFLLIGGAVIVIIAFGLDHIRFLLEHYSLKKIFSFPPQHAFEAYMQTYIPEHFAWGLFAAGSLLILFAILLFIIRNRKHVGH
jgi:ABC-type maltose transport system permease subunit